MLRVNDSGHYGVGGPRSMCEGLGGGGQRLKEGLPLGSDLLTESSRMSLKDEWFGRKETGW